MVFCPKYRRPVLVDAVQPRLEELLRVKARELGATLHALEIMPDHVHLFVEADPTLARSSHPPPPQFPR
jgi:putative transposase